MKMARRLYLEGKYGLIINPEFNPKKHIAYRGDSRDRGGENAYTLFRNRLSPHGNLLIDFGGKRLKIGSI